MQLINDLVETCQTSSWINDANFRQENRHWLKHAECMAAKICIALRKHNVSKQQLAYKLLVDVETVNRIVKGRDNMTIQMISEIEQILKIKLL